MKRQIIDTNVVLRYLVGDSPAQQQQARQWFEEASQGKHKLVLKPLIVAEVCFVLESFYKQDRIKIADAMEVFVSQKWLEVEEKNTLKLMWKWYREGLHFVDSYLASWAAENKADILTFDKELLGKIS